MASNFYFFTDTNLLSPQTSTTAFGPAGSVSGADLYRTTSMHTATAHPNAYAVCDGIVCVQRIPGAPGLVNLLLKPLAQPDLNLSPVKCFIYKGIREASLISGTDVAPAGNNRLTASLWDTQAKKNQSAGTSATAPAAALGVDMAAAAVPNSLPGTPLFPDTDLIETLFYQEKVTFQLPVVKGGWSIGQFDKGGFGFEVLMEGLGFQHTLALGRTLENKISVPSLPGTATPAEVFDHWHAKEQVLGFMDPCAFYGSFFLAGVRAKGSTDNSFHRKSGNDLYNDVLSCFINRNTAYLDIRNEHNYSLDYFNNYGRQIQLSYDPGTDAPVPVDYYGSGWPILKLESANFPSSNSTKARNPFRIQLPVGDNAVPLLYVSQGYRDMGSQGNGFPPELKSADRFFDAFQTPAGASFTDTKGDSGLTSMTFVVPNVTGQGATTPVSCNIRLKYFKQQQTAPTASTSATAVTSANYLDNLIYPLDLRIPFAGGASVMSSVYAEEVYVDAQSVDGVNCDFVGSVGIARDADNTTFFVVPTSVRRQEGQASTLVSLVGESTDTTASYPELVASKYSQQQVQASFLTVAGNSVPVAEFASSAPPGAKKALAEPDFDKLVLFSVENSACDAWSGTAAGLDDRFRTYLGVKNLQTLADDAGTEYTSFELSLRGYAPDTTTDGYIVQEVSTGLVLPTSDATLYAPARKKVTCEISSGADGRPSACVPTNGSIQLTAVPSSGTGTFKWSIIDSITGKHVTITDKIQLINHEERVVTVKGRGTVSTAMGAEKVQLIFKPKKGDALPPVTRDVTVISVAFTASNNQRYGYDGMSGQANHHVSIRSEDATTVHVTVTGGGTADDLEFSSGDVTIAIPVAPLPGAGDSFELCIDGGNQTKAETSIMTKCKGGPVCATLEANVYRQKDCKATVIRVRDSNSPGTKLLAGAYDVDMASLHINSSYKAAVVKLDLQDMGPGIVDIPYDIDGGGFFTYEPSGGMEWNLLKYDSRFDNITGCRVFVIRKFRYVYRLWLNAAAGDTTVTFSAHYSDHDLGKIEFNTDYVLGTVAGSESVRFSSRAGNVFTLVTPLTDPHPEGDGLIFPIEGISLGDGKNAIVQEPNPPDHVNLYWTIGHEIGHALLNLRDLNAPTNLMNHEALWADHRLRYKNEPLHTPIKQQDGSIITMQSQWQAIPRT